MTNTAPRWVKRTIARDYLNVSDATFYRYAAAGLVTRHTIGGTTRYDLNEIDAMLKSGSVAAYLRTPASTEALDPDAADDVIARIRAALPPDVPGAKPLIQIARVHAAIDKVAADLGVDGPTP